MLSGTPSGSITRYKPLPRPKQQQKFPSRRRSVKPRNRATPEGLSRDQSTLTQLDFVSTPSVGRGVIDISSDDGFEEIRPKKKQRTAKSGVKERRQATLTQMVDVLGSRHIEEVDEDGFQIWDDSDQERVVEGTVERHEELRKDMPWLRRLDDDNAENVLEIPETSLSEAPSLPLKVDSGAQAKAGVKVAALKTPSKTRRKEIPSSQTPPSTEFSTINSMRTQIAQRSPLMEKTGNVQLLAWNQQSPESQNTCMKMLHRVWQGTRKVPLNDSHPCEAAPQHLDGAADDGASPQQGPQKRPRKLQRVPTVQDSQVKDLDLDDTTLVAESPIIIKSTPMFQRSATIQDSQYDGAIILSDDMPDEDHEFNELQEHEQQHSYVGYTQATFDPVNSALDRDAARFGWTQTQPGIFSDVKERHEDNETDDEDDLDRGCGAGAYAEPIRERAESMTEFAQSKDDTTAKSSGVKPIVDASPCHSSLDEAGDITVVPDEIVPSSSPVQHLEPSKVHRDKGDTKEVVSSSPPVLHLSQVITVVPTQASLRHKSSNEIIIVEQSLPLTYLSEASTIGPHEASPQKPRKNFQHAPSSSPIPLPPWSSPHQAPLEEAMMGKAVGIKDWSLPPPPPVSSSGVSTPTSSSR